MLCQVRLIDSDLWQQIGELKTIYAQVDDLSAVKIKQKMREFTDKAVRGELLKYVGIHHVTSCAYLS